MAEDSSSMIKKDEARSTTIEALERENKELKVKLDRQIKETQLSDQRLVEQSARCCKQIRAQRIEINEWKKKCFRMKGAAKIQEELLAAETNITETEIRVKKAIHALEEELYEASSEFQDRKDELEDQLAFAKDTDDEVDPDDEEEEYY